MKLNPSLFWDINISELSFEDSKDWIIERVFDRGSLDEVISVINYYGKENVKKTIQAVPTYLPNHTILLAKALFNLHFSDFKCLEKRPFLPNY
jgi:hypothetical protein